MLDGNSYSVLFYSTGKEIVKWLSAVVVGTAEDESATTNIISSKATRQKEQ
jgi:hypothetical protein